MKRQSLMMLGVSLLFAALMLMSGWFIADQSTRQTAVFLLIAVWSIPYSILMVKCGRCRC